MYLHTTDKTSKQRLNKLLTPTEVITYFIITNINNTPFQFATISRYMAVELFCISPY